MRRRLCYRWEVCAFWWRRRESNFRVKSEEIRVELPLTLPPFLSADLNAWKTFENDEVGRGLQ